MEKDPLGGIAAGSVPLTALDSLMSFYNHPLVHFFENKRASPDFMPGDALKASLSAALREFPLLLGHICDTRGGAAAAVVDCSSTNTPEFVESSSAVHFSDIRRAKFSWDAWPSGVATAGPVTTPVNGVVKLLSIHVVRLASNSGVILFCNIPHFVVDGVGYYEFLGCWARLFRNSRSNGAASAVGPEPTRFTFDRELFASWMHGARRPLSPTLHGMLTGGGVLLQTLERIPFATRTRLVAAGSSVSYGHGHVFHVSRTALEALCSRAQAQAPDGAELTSYSLLTALFSTAIFQARAARRQKSSYVVRAVSAAAAAVLRHAVSVQAEPRMLLNVVHTHHLHPADAACYIGNSVYLHPMNIAEPVAGAGVDELSGAAIQIALALRGVDRGLVSEFHATVGAHPLAYASLAVHMAARPDALTVIDERHYKTGGMDFGDGGPAWVSGLPRHLPNFVAFFAAPELAGGARVYVSLGAATVDALLRDAHFTAHAEFVY
ncbi:hypothetical protein LPJ61_000651 [Coemansia biformis]|uniref:Acyltransferase n=1 Tax=Coemansia biformis TaxID=1286918 RepID=A0A9W7YHH8_9FUNG|nr:hypothetical protein LPJ61_000651 [Coemansia biformis]